MKEEQGSIVWHLLVPLCVTGIIIMLMLFGFSNKIRSDAIVTFERSMTEVAESYAQKIKIDLQTTYEIGTVVAGIIEAQEEPDSGIIGLSLKELTDQTELYAAELYTADGKIIDQDGQEIAIADRDFLPNLNSKSDVQYLYLKKDQGVVEDTVLIVIPTSKTKGALLLYYPSKRIKSQAKVNREFDQTAFSILITSEGEVLQEGDMQSSFLTSSNLMDSLDKNSYSAMMGAKVKMQSKNSGCFAALAGDEARTLIYAPLEIDNWNLVLGVNQSYVDSRETQKWSETSQMLYQFLAVILLCVIALFVTNMVSKVRNAEKSKLLQEKVDTDLLTGLNNKLATERKIKEYLASNPDTLSMMFVLDIDNFKKINDTMGHAFGDEVLRTLGKQISSNFRVSDIIGRTGGDEFIILLKNLKDDDSILREAKKLVYFFKGFQVGEYVKYSATASIGAAVFPADGQNFEALYKSADSALYRAKKQGKNQLAFFDERDFAM